MPSKKKPSKKRSRPSSNGPVELLEDHRREEITMAFKGFLGKDETTLTVSQAKKCLKNLAISVKSDEILSFFGGDEKQIEELDQSMFLHIAASKIIQQDKAYKAFELLDQDGRGVLVLEDLQRVAQELGEDMSKEDLEEMMAFADRSGEGLLQPEDIVRIARKVNL